MISDALRTRARAFARDALAPVLVATWPVLSLYHQNAREAEPRAAARALAVSLGLGLAATAAFRRALATRAAASLHASFFVALLSLSGLAFSLLEKTVSRGFPSVDALPEIASLALAAILCAAYAALRRLSRPLRDAAARHVQGAVEIVAGALVAAALMLSLFHGTSVLRSAPARPSVQPPAAARPDVYVIVLDGYGRADLLRKVLGFDNRPFLESLRRRGFTVADAARADHATTPEAVAALLNLAPLRAAELAFPRDRIRHNRFQALARAAGHKLYSVDSGWLVTSDFPLSDVHVTHYWSLNEFERKLLEGTALGAWMPFLARNDQRRVLNRNMREIRRFLDREESPQCVVAHLVLPHPPYLFGANGEAVPQGTSFNPLGPWKDPEGYIAQARFLNRWLLGFADAVAARRGAGAVVLLTSDHGTCFRGTVGGDAPGLREERLAVFLAVRGPAALQAEIPADTTPAAALRKVAAFVFGTAADTGDRAITKNSK